VERRHRQRDRRDIAKLRSIPGVQAVYPVLKVSLGPQWRISPATTSI